MCNVSAWGIDFLCFNVSRKAHRATAHVDQPKDSSDSESGGINKRSKSQKIEIPKDPNPKRSKSQSLWSFIASEMALKR
jgi:hypothetical protein